MVGELVGPVEVVVLDVFEVVVLDVVLLVVVGVGGSSVMVPMTQYDLVMSKVPGQVRPGLSFVSSSTDRPQLLAKLSHVSLLLGGVEKAQSTARGDRRAAVPIETRSPLAMTRCFMGDILGI